MWEMTFADAVLKETEGSFDVILPTTDQDYYSHPTFVVNNLSDYISLISKISTVKDGMFNDEAVIYRGMSNSEYTLLPGLARYNKRFPKMESELINEFLTKRPDAFSGLSAFDMLAKMQHYGLPTRLLDFTINPLVALYFACAAHNSEKGRVLCTSTYLQNDDTNEIVKAVCTSSEDMLYKHCPVEKYYCNDRLPLKRYMSFVYLRNGMTVVRPKYWNQRIANQGGVFMVFQNNLIDTYKKVLVHASKYGLDQTLQSYEQGVFDRQILEEALNIEPIEYYRNDKAGYLTENCFKQIFAAYSEAGKISAFWENIKNRFIVTDAIKPLGQEAISNEFCSILIEPENKEMILKELSYIGFGTDYIYPELEYTAKEIKRRFEQ